MRLEVRGLVQRFGAVTALNGVELAVEEGEFVTILGPSGSGKTTLLKSVAGFEVPDAGSVRLGDRDVTLAPARDRNVGMVFQNYALFPHLTVAQNLAFPLEMRRTPKPEIARRVHEALALVELDSYAQRLPRQLSGGQQQRVALARAIIFNPALLLLDEPFGALDRKLRESLQLEVRRLQRRLRLTTLFITHDQEEALILSDRIAVMDGGRIQQLGLPAEVYDRPVSRFVADFIGESNLIEGMAESGTVVVPGFGALTLQHPPAPGPVTLLLRPEALRLGPEAQDAQCRGVATVLETIFLGLSVKLRLRLEGGPDLLARLPLRPSDPPPAPDGTAIAVGFLPQTSMSSRVVDRGGWVRRRERGLLLLGLPALLVLGMLFAWPVLRLLSMAVADGTLHQLGRVVLDDLYRAVLFDSLEIAGLVTGLCLVLAYPVAFWLTRAGRLGFALGMFALLLPFWTSVLVRTYAWMVLLGRSGVVNRTLRDWGIIDYPLPLLHNLGGVLIGMVHVLLPYMVLPIYAALLRIDPDLPARRGGARGTRIAIFRRIILPLSLPGVAAGCALVFVLSLGFFITPALLGGGRVMMIAMLIEQQVRELLDWPFAAALSAVLLALTLIIYAVIGRLTRGARHA